MEWVGFGGGHRISVGDERNFGGPDPTDTGVGEWLINPCGIDVADYSPADDRHAMKILLEACVRPSERIHVCGDQFETIVRRISQSQGISIRAIAKRNAERIERGVCTSRVPQCWIELRWELCEGQLCEG